MKLANIKSMLTKLGHLDWKFVRKPYSLSMVVSGGSTIARGLSHSRGEWFAKSPELVDQLMRMVGVAKETMRAIASDPETYEGILARKCLTELERLEGE
jgi:hypothetical protein